MKFFVQWITSVMKVLSYHGRYLNKFYVCAGMCSTGIASAGGAGKALADCIVNGHFTNDMWDVDIRRFHPQSANLKFLEERTIETLGLHFVIPWPRRELTTARNLRLSPLHSRHCAENAVFQQNMGWERPNYFGQASDPPHND